VSLRLPARVLRRVLVVSAVRIGAAHAGNGATCWPAATSSRGARAVASAAATQRSMLIPSRRPNANPAATAATGTAAMPTTAGGTSGVSRR